MHVNLGQWQNILRQLQVNINSTNPSNIGAFSTKSGSCLEIAEQVLKSVYFNSNPLAHSPDTDASVFAVWTQTAVVPVPAAIWLFGSGLIGLVGMRGNTFKLSTFSA